MLKDFFSLFFPNICASCNADLKKGEKHVCSQCYYHLPRSNYHLDKENPVAKTFWGRVDVKQAGAFLLFNKGGITQNLIHRLKYKGDKELGVFLGSNYGSDIINSSFYEGIDIVIPVPLHKTKERARGYNQSYFFSKGLAESLKKECITDALVREMYTDSQTGKSRFKRWENVKEVFKVIDPKKIEGKHILLVDDVVTTGATLEACAKQLLEVEGVKVSIVTIAYAA